MCAASIEQLIDRRINKWKQLNLPRKAKAQPVPPKPVITISRAYGAGGKQVADDLANSMGLVLFDRELIDHIADEGHIGKKIITSLDEGTRSAMEAWVEGILKARIFDRSDYTRCLLEVMKSLAMRGGCIILGRGGNFILQGEPGVYHFRIVAPLEMRVERIARLEGISKAQAEKLVMKTHKARVQYLKDNFKASSGDDPTVYHAVLNSGRMSFDAIANFIKQYVSEAEKNRMKER